MLPRDTANNQVTTLTTIFVMRTKFANFLISAVADYDIVKIVLKITTIKLSISFSFLLL